MRRLQLILIDSLSESFPSAGRISQQNQVPCTCANQICQQMRCSVIGEILCLLRTLAKLARSEDQKLPYALPNAKYVARSSALWVSGIAATPAGPLFRLGPDSSAASGGPFVTCRASKLEDWLIFHWLSISRNCLDVTLNIFHGFFMASGSTLSFRIICRQCWLRWTMVLSLFFGWNSDQKNKENF